MSRPMKERKGRRCRQKSSLRMWLDRVVMSALKVAQKEHPNAALKDQWTLNLIRKRIAGSISDGLERKLEKHGIQFPEEGKDDE